MRIGIRPRLMGAAAGLVAAAMTVGAPLDAAWAERAQMRAPNVQRGVAMARTYCVRCHAIDKVSPSPLTAAPPFRDLHKRYPVEQLEEPLAEGLVTGHPSMPEFRFDPGQVDDFIAFLKSLE